MVNDSSYDTQTTNEMGVAELTSPQINTVGVSEYIVKHGDVEYPTSVEVVEIAEIFLTPSDTIAYDGGDISLRAVVVDDDGNPISDLKITLNDEVYTTDLQGVANGIYTGTGTAGRTEIVASCGNTETSVFIEDVMQYWSQTNNKKHNLNYSTKGQISVEEEMTGILLVTAEGKGYREEGRMVFSNPYRISESWEFSFDIVGLLKGEASMWVSLADITNVIKVGSTVKVTYDKSTGVRKVFVDNVQISSNSNTQVIDSEIKLIGRVKIDNVKLMRV